MVQDIDKTMNNTIVDFQQTKVKSTLLCDIDDVFDDTQIRGIKGDIIEMPFWLYRKLERNRKVAKIKSKMLVQLKQALVKEQLEGSDHLSTLDDTFYLRLKAELIDMDGHEFEKITHLVSKLFRIRRGKIIKMADAETNNTDTLSRLTIEERDFYNSIHQSSTKFENTLSDIINFDVEENFKDTGSL